MPDETKLHNIQIGEKTLVQIFKLPQQMIDYLWERIDIAKKNPICHKNNLAGNISHSYILGDPQNVVIRKLYNIVFNQVDNPKMFEFITNEVIQVYSRSNYENLTNDLEPYLSGLWVNFQKKGEFQPIHNHTGVFSFVIWMDIPYHSKDEAKLHFARSSLKKPPGGNFSFVTSGDTNRSVGDQIIKLSPEKNGYCCFFPSDLSHQVYPFYTSDKDRISISGNIHYRPRKPTPPPVYQFPFHMSET
tara:strand:+ start:142 stop:876 length:735 start_codon:yes stop_codon:yes gene_type:complete